MKKGRKILSLGLAAAMAVSVGTAAFAAAADEVTYRAEYTKNNPKESITTTIDQLDTVLDGAVVTGDTLEALYGILPSLSALVYDENNKQSNNSEFYTNLDPVVFANLPEGTVTAESLAAYFEEYPVKIADSTEFLSKADAIVDAILCENIGTTLAFLPVMTPDVNFAEFATSIDKLCSALGIEQKNSIAEGFGWNGTYQANVSIARTYVKNIVHALIPDMATNILGILHVALTGQNAADLYAGLKGVIDNLAGVVTALSGSLGSLGVDLTEITNTITSIQNIFNSIPTKETEFGTAIDAEATISALPGMLGDILPLFGVDLPLDLSAVLAISFDEPPKGFQMIKLTLESFNDANIDAAADNEDFLMVVANYIYRNFVANTDNNSALQTVLGIVGSMLPAEVTNLLKALLATPSFDAFVWALRDQVSILSGNGTIGAYPGEQPSEDPSEQPSEDPSEQPSEDPSEQPSEDPSEQPSEDPSEQPSEDPSEQPSEDSSDEPSTDGTTAAPSTTAPAGTGSSTNNDTPDTGDAVLSVVAFAGVAAAASLVLLRKKK